MNTTESIKFLERNRYTLSINEKELKHCAPIDQTIYLLKRGKEYEKMWNLLNHKFGGVCLDQSYSDEPGNMGVVVVQDLMKKVKVLFSSGPKTKKEELEKLAREIIDIIRKSNLSFIKFKDEEENV